MLAQGAQANAKEDTVLLLLQAEADPWIDLSQYGVDLIEDAAYYESPSALRALTGEGGRELYVQAVIETTDATALLLYHGTTTDPSINTYAIFLNASGDIEFRQDSVTLATIELALGGDSTVSVHWSTRPNPDTTGSSDALISEMIVYDHTAEVYSGRTQVVHEVAATDPTWSLTVGGFWNGAAILLAATPILRCRIGKAWHPSPEFGEDWIGARPSLSSTLTVPDYLLPHTLDSGLGDEGQWAGQANIGWIAEDNARKRWAQWSPLVNESYTDAVALSGEEEVPAQWFSTMPGGGYRMRLDYLRWVTVPRGATHAWVRVHVVSYAQGGGDPVPVQLACVAMNRPPFGLGPAGGDTFAYAKVESTLLDVDHTFNGIGEWLNLGLVRLPIYTGATPGWRDTVHLALGWAWDPEGTSLDVTIGRLRIKAWHARPLFKSIGGPGLG